MTDKCEVMRSDDGDLIERRCFFEATGLKNQAFLQITSQIGLFKGLNAQVS
jgi:hypothetical protein